MAHWIMDVARKVKQSVTKKRSLKLLFTINC